MRRSSVPILVRIKRDKYAPFVAGIISVPKVTPCIVHSVSNADPTIEILVNVPKNSMWTGFAITAAAARGVAFGSIKDLMSAVSYEDVRRYMRREYDFVERGLRQHTSRVLRLEREADRFSCIGTSCSPLRVVLLNEYELTADHVRTVRDRYGAWYGFGSYFRGQAAFSDIDILVVCRTTASSTFIRARTVELCARWPLHLVIMTEDEEAEANFLASAGCKLLWRLQPGVARL